MHWDTFKQDNHNTSLGGDQECRASKVQASTASPMPDHKGLKLQ